MLRIEMAGVTILGAPKDLSRPVHGLYVGKDGFQGWEDGGGETRRDAIPRPGQHGEYDLPVLQGSRPMMIDGHALAESDYELLHLRDRIMGVCADGQRYRLIVEHLGETRWTYVRRGAKPTFRSAGIRFGRRYAAFMLSLVAADPRMFGEMHEYPAGLPAVHYGNFPAVPVLEVSGAPSGYTITGPGGKTFTVTQGLAAGQKHRIDMATGRVYRDGSLQVGVVSNGGTWAIPPGVPGVTHGISAGSLRVLVTDTFV